MRDSEALTDGGGSRKVEFETTSSFDMSSETVPALSQSYRES